MDEKQKVQWRTALQEMFAQSPVIREVYAAATGEASKVRILGGLMDTIRENGLLDHYVEAAGRRSILAASHGTRFDLTT